MSNAGQIAEEGGGGGRGTRLTSRRPLDMAINNKAKMAAKAESRNQKKGEKKPNTNTMKPKNQSGPKAKRRDTNRAKCDMSNARDSS